MSSKSKLSIGGSEELREKLSRAKQELESVKKEDHSQTTTASEDNHATNQVAPESSPTVTTTSTSIKNNFKTKAINPKLYVAGRFNRKVINCLNKGFYILEGLDSEIKSLCAGTDITVYNYLISLGLETVKQQKEVNTVNADDLVQKYK